MIGLKYIVALILLYFAIMPICVSQEAPTFENFGMPCTWPQDCFDIDFPDINVTIANFAIYSYSKIKGEGFHNFKENIRAGNLGLNNSGHGSGALDAESQKVSFYNTRITNLIGDTLAVSNYRIRTNGSADYVYGPADFYFGKYFKAGPFRSKGVDETCLENIILEHDQNRTGTSMKVRFDNSDVYSRDITTDLHRRSRTFGVEDVNYTSLTYANTSLALEAAFTGKLHIGALRLQGRRQLGNNTTLVIGNNTVYHKRSRYHVVNMVDEDYSGTFSVTTKMVATYAYGISLYEENFIPCCFEGWNTMPPIYQRKFGRDTRGIFDCRCHLGYAYGIDVPLVPIEAEFHNVPGSY